MLFVPEAVHGMANKLEPHAEATKAHATRIASAGFEASHAGRDYQEHGHKIVAGVEGVVSMLHSWSEASSATAGAFRTAVTSHMGIDQDRAAGMARATGSLG